MATVSDLEVAARHWALLSELSMSASGLIFIGMIWKRDRLTRLAVGKQARRLSLKCLAVREKTGDLILRSNGN